MFISVQRLFPHTTANRAHIEKILNESKKRVSSVRLRLRLKLSSPLNGTISAVRLHQMLAHCSCPNLSLTTSFVPLPTEWNFGRQQPRWVRARISITGLINTPDWQIVEKRPNCYSGFKMLLTRAVIFLSVFTWVSDQVLWGLKRLNDVSGGVGNGIMLHLVQLKISLSVLGFIVTDSVFFLL